MGTEIELDWSKMLECEITEWVAANKLLMPIPRCLMEGC